jgi:hypothetical protein
MVIVPGVKVNVHGIVGSAVVALFGHKVNLLDMANIFVKYFGNIGLAVISKDVRDVKADILNGGHILISLMQFVVLDKCN